MSDEEDGTENSETSSDHSGVFPGARPSGETLPDVEDEDEDEDGFIDHDSDNEVQVELPAQFSRQSHQDMNAHFKIVCKSLILGLDLNLKSPRPALCTPSGLPFRKRARDIPLDKSTK